MDAFPSLYDCNELTLCNDSVFAPMGSYEPVYNAMKNVNCDFWGLTASKEIMPHLQSFHLVFRKKVLEHAAFKQFVDAIPCITDRKVLIQFEVKLSAWLSVHDLVGAAYFSAGFFELSPSVVLWKEILSFGVPSLKRELLTKHFPFMGSGFSERLWSTIEHKNYPRHLMTSYFYRIGIDISHVNIVGCREKTCQPNILLQQQPLDISKNGDTTYSIAVVLHCYYVEELSEIMGYLQHLPKRVNFYVSTDTEEKALFIRQSLSPFEFSTLDIRKVPNKGWDVASFLIEFKDAILSHDVVLKIHAKKSPTATKELLEEWKNTLYLSLMGSQEHIEGILYCFSQDEKLGIIAPPPDLRLCRIAQDHSDNEKGNLQFILKHWDFNLPPDHAIDFPAGTMFWARTAALKPLFDLNFSYDDFVASTPFTRHTLAHSVERSIFFSAYAAGYTWGRVPPAPYTALRPSNGSILSA